MTSAWLMRLLRVALVFVTAIAAFAWLAVAVSLAGPNDFLSPFWSPVVTALALLATLGVFYGCRLLFNRSYPGGYPPVGRLPIGWRFRERVGTAMILMIVAAGAAAIHYAKPEKISHSGVDPGDSRQ